MKPHIIALATGFVFTLSGAASAQDEPAANWLSESFVQAIDVKGKAAADFEYTGYKATSLDPSKPEIRFGCSERFGLTATITFVPRDAQTQTKRAIRLDRTRSNMTIEGRETVQVPWTFVRATRTVQTRQQKHAAMIYNAIVQGQSITIKEPRKKQVTLTPPPADDAFKEFAMACPVTNGS